MDKPPIWFKLAEEAVSEGKSVFLLGAPDTGKTTLCKFLLEKAIEKGLKVGYIDADVGQSTIGPPTTMGLSILEKREDLEGLIPFKLYFLGATSPAQWLLRSVVGLRKLMDKALERRVDFTLIDTTGLVTGEAGFQLKFYEIEITDPTHLVAIEREGELEPILKAFVGRSKPKQYVILPSEKVRRRDLTQRQHYRQQKLSLYFKNSEILNFEKGLLKNFKGDQSFPLDGRIVGLLDEEGFALGIGVITGIKEREIEVLTPIKAQEAVKALWLGEVKLEGGAQNVCNPGRGLSR